jgi:hypothetical protein
VFVNYPAAEAGWYQMRVSDADGLCTFVGLSLDEALISAHKYPEGYMTGQRINLPGGLSAPIEIVFDPDWELRVVLLERGSRKQGLDVAADDPDRLRHLPRATSDIEGIANIARVSGPGWKVSVAHPGYWPAEYIVNPTDPNPFPIEVRRLGSIEFTLKTIYGDPASGIAIELQSEEMSQSTTSWVEAGRVHVSNPDRRTGADGRLRFDALPNGPYRWRATTPSGEVIDGEVTIPPQATARVESTTP